MRNADEAFDLGVTLNKRLDEINHQKDDTQAKINLAAEQLKKLFDKGKKKYRETPEQLEAKIKDLERRRTTTSLPLAEEKDILRQIGMVKKTLVQIEENKDHELLIQEKKAEVTNLRDSLRIIIAQMAELEGALSKVELAKRLGCATKDLTTHVLDCPSDKLGQVIGKNGSNIKQLETQTGCMIDVDKVKSQVHLHGSETAISRAIDELENITLSVEESVILTEAVHTHLFRKRKATFNKLQSLYPNVFFDLPREKTVINLRGKPEAVANAKDSILAITVEMDILEVTGRETALVVGKGGMTVNKFVDDYKVAIEVSKETENKSNVKIVGTTENVAAAKAAIQDLIYKNEDVEVQIIVNSLTRNLLLSDSGMLMKMLQKEVNEKCEHGNTIMNFEKLTKEEIKSNATSILTVKASRVGIEEAAEIVKSRIDAYVADTLTMKVDVDIVPQIIGKGGNTINKLKSIGAGAEIRIEKSTGEIKVLGSKEAMVKIKNEIDDIVSKNQVINVPVDESMLGFVFGHQGKELKEEIAAKDVLMTNGVSQKYIKLRGRLEMITEAASVVRDFLDNNYLVEVQYQTEDEEVLMRGDASILNKLQTKYGVKVTIAKQRLTVMVRGKQKDAVMAKNELNKFLHGGDGTLVSRIAIPGNAIGMIIGKGGSNISQLRSNHEGVSISIGRLSNCICLRGGEDEVRNCRGEIIQSVAAAKMTETLKIDNESFVKLTKPGVKTKLLSEIPVHTNITPSSVKLRGLCDDVNDVKAYFEDFISGIYKGHVTLDPSLANKASDMKELEQIYQTTKTTITFDKHRSAFQLTGKRSNVKKAKLLLMVQLESFLPSQFCKVKMAKPLVQSVGRSVELAKIAAESGCMVCLDRDINVITVQSSCEIDVSRGVELINNRIRKCEKLVCVIRIENHDGWLLSKFLTKGNDVLSKIESDGKCRVNFYKEELMICISGANENDVAAGKEHFEAFASKARKENVFINLPETSVNQFIGKSRSNINQFAQTYDVQIDRVKKTASKILICGDEISVQNTVSAVKAWVQDWEAKNQGNVLSLDSGEITNLLGSNRILIKDTEKVFKVKIEVDRVKCTLVIRGENRNEASDKICSLVGKYRDLKQQQNATEIERVSEEKQAKTLVADPKILSMSEKKSTLPEIGATVTKEINVLDDIASKDIPKPSISPIEEQPMTSNIETKASSASNLFNLLISDTPDEHDQWDSSTLSSGITSDNVVGTPVNGGGYYKSASGFAVRL